MLMAVDCVSPKVRVSFAEAAGGLVEMLIGLFSHY